jgi:hypothetical protein
MGVKISGRDRTGRETVSEQLPTGLAGTVFDRPVSLWFGVLFFMIIDPSKSTVPFASINDVGYYADEEDEVLFAMHTVFRISDTKSMDKKHHLFRVELALISDNDKDLHVITDCIREENFAESSTWHRLGLVLFKMGQSEKAEQVYQTLLKQETSPNGKTSIYNQLG